MRSIYSSKLPVLGAERMCLQKCYHKQISLPFIKRYLDGVEPTTSTTTTTTTTTTAAPSGGGCFPSASKVKLKNGKSVMMSELQIGDQVQTGTVAGFLISVIISY